MENLVNEIQELQLAKAAQEQLVKDANLVIADLDAKIEAKKAELIAEMDANKVEITDTDELTAQIFQKENVGYSDEAAVLAYLKENYQQFVKTKITESIDKNPLKKELKANAVLAEALDAMTTKSVTRYVVVTTHENHLKMLEHINEGK